MISQSGKGFLTKARGISNILEISLACVIDQIYIIYWRFVRQNIYTLFFGIGAFPLVSGAFPLALLNSLSHYSRERIKEESVENNDQESRKAANRMVSYYQDSRPTRRFQKPVGKSSKLMKKKELIATWITPYGWEADRFGHFQKNTSKSRYRLKLTKAVVRLERHAVICGKNEWRRLRSEYYSKITQAMILNWPGVV